MTPTPTLTPGGIYGKSRKAEMQEYLQWHHAKVVGFRVPSGEDIYVANGFYMHMNQPPLRAAEWTPCNDGSPRLIVEIQRERR